MDVRRPQPTGADMPTDDIARRILAVAREEFIRFGIRRASVEAIARKAGVSRVTLYRRFDSKHLLLRAVVLTDIIAFFERLDAVLSAPGPIDARVEEAVVLCVNELRRQPLLSTVLRSEPESVLTSLTLDGQAEFERIRGTLAARIGALAARGEMPVGDPVAAAELMLRLGYSVVLFPYGVLPGRTDAEIRAFARRFVTPQLVGRGA